MKTTELSKKFFRLIDERLGPFDRPFKLRVFPFDAGGALNLMTVGAGREEFVTYVTWDLFGHEKQKRGKLGRYELSAVSDSEDWCIDILTKIGLQSFENLFEGGDTLDIGAWVGKEASIQAILFEEAYSTQIRVLLRQERCGVLRCIGITRSELEYAKCQGVPALVQKLKDNGVYPRTATNRASVT